MQYPYTILYYELDPSTKARVEGICRSFMRDREAYEFLFNRLIAQPLSEMLTKSMTPEQLVSIHAYMRAVDDLKAMIESCSTTANEDFPS